MPSWPADLSGLAGRCPWVAQGGTGRARFVLDWVKSRLTALWQNLQGLDQRHQWVFPRWSVGCVSESTTDGVYLSQPDPPSGKLLFRFPWVDAGWELTGSRRLARRGGVKRISAGIYEEVRIALLDRLKAVSTPSPRPLEASSNPRQILKDAILFTEHRQAKTVTINDVSCPLSRPPAAHETPSNKPGGVRSSGASDESGSRFMASTRTPTLSLAVGGLYSMNSGVVETGVGSTAGGVVSAFVSRFTICGTTAFLFRLVSSLLYIHCLHLCLIR